MLFLADCQSVAGVISDKTRLCDDFFRQPYLRMARNIQSIFAKQRWPRQDRDDYVRWVPRRHNAPADHLANVSLDESGDYSWKTDSFADDFRHDQLAVTSDGGFRGRAGSSAAWIMWKIGRQHEKSHTDSVLL